MSSKNAYSFPQKKKYVGSWRNKIILWGSSLVDVNKEQIVHLYLCDICTIIALKKILSAFAVHMDFIYACMRQYYHLSYQMSHSIYWA